MRLAGIFVVILILISVIFQAVIPACAWYWPIMGFMPPGGGCPNICGGPALPPPYDAMTPGTLQWGYPPIDRARLSYPGCAYGPKAFQGALDFGSQLPFGSRIPAFYAPQAPAPEAGNTSEENTTATEAGRANNTTRSAGNATGNITIGQGAAGIRGRNTSVGNSGSLLGWLSSR